MQIDVFWRSKPVGIHGTEIILICRGVQRPVVWALSAFEVMLKCRAWTADQ